MKEINNKRVAEEALKYLWHNEQHDVEKIRKLHEKSGVKVPIEWLIADNPWEKWNREERLELIKICEYDMDDRTITFLLNRCIRRNNYFGFDLLLSAGAKISPSTIRDEIVQNYQLSDDAKLNYCQRIIEAYKDYDGIPMALDTHHSEKTICYNAPSLLDDRTRFSGELVFRDQDISLLDSIVSSEDIRLLKLWLPLIDDASPLLTEAVTTGELEKVKLLLQSNPIDLDYVKVRNAYYNPTILDENAEKMTINNDFEIKYTTPSLNGFCCPLLLAAIYNDLEMIKLLVSAGCNINFVPVKDGKKEYLPYFRKIAKERKREYPEISMTPLEYLLTECSFNNSHRVQIDINIIKYLYDCGATFANGKIDYTLLIKEAMAANNERIAKYFLSEAYKKSDYVLLNPLLDIDGFMDLVPDFAKYSKKLDPIYHEQNMKRYLIHLFGTLEGKCTLKDSKYYELIKDYSRELSKEVLQTIPIPSCFCDKESLDELIGLGYNVNATNEDGYTILECLASDPIKEYSSEISSQDISVFNNLINQGCNPNFISENGESALSLAIRNENFELAEKLLTYANDDVVKSEMVKDAIETVMNGYLQHNYSNILFGLANKGFTIDDDYFRSSIKGITLLGFDLYVKGISDDDMWNFLNKLYRTFDNQAVGYNYHFPSVEKFKEYKYEDPQTPNLLWLIKEHLNRCFITKEEQLKDEAIITKESAAWRLLDEITRYVPTLDYRLIINLIESFPIIDIAALNNSRIMDVAFDTNPNLYSYLLSVGVEPSTKLKQKQLNETRENEEQVELVNLLQDLGCEDVDSQVLKRRKGE